MTYVFDIESDGLLDNVTKVHCLSYYCIENGESHSLTKKEEIVRFIEQEDNVFIGHNIVRYDIPVLRKLFNINIKGDLIDTLAISWVLDEDRISHGLESYGEEFGIEKPKITDWSSLTTEEYVFRCERDVQINTKLWNKQIKYLSYLYDGDDKNLKRYFKYLTFKLDCVYEQETVGLKVDDKKIHSTLDSLKKDKESKYAALKKCMPKVAIKKKKIYTNAIKDENGNIFQRGDLFFTEGETKEIVEEQIIGWEEPNPNSHIQIKKWLFDLGWIPQNIKYQRNKKTGEVKQIPQIKDRLEEGELCESIKILYSKEPALENLDGFFILSHRISILEGFINNLKNGRIYPSMDGLTNTLRLQHRVIVNLPRAKKPYGQSIRDCIIRDDNNSILCGSDLSGIEDSTKRHYMYQYDPEYVIRMGIPGYDSHLEMAIRAGYINEEDCEWYKIFDEERKKEGYIAKDGDIERYTDINAKRYKAKTTNFAALYKSGALTLSKTAGIPMAEAKKLLKVYWMLNKAVLDVEDGLTIKEIGSKKWLFNPVSKFWYSLRADKDKFSTLNQGTAVYVFDKWLTLIRKAGIIVPFQYHDEWATNIPKSKKSELKKIIDASIKQLNESLKLNVEIKCSIEFGNTYGTIH